MRIILAATCAAVLCGTASVQAQTQYPFQDPSLALDKRVDNILSLMTIDEKIKCLEFESGVPRLNIPSGGWSEGLHGLVRKGDFGAKGAPTTTFAEVIGMASTWDPDLIRRAGAVQGYEARYIYQNPKYKDNVLIVWGPNADLARDPRWGRNNESYGEDPFFTGTMSVAFIRGMQGDDPKYWQAASLMKHFLANSNETTRGRSSSDFDERLLREYYSVPFRMGFEAGAKSFMASYNAWNGVPMTVHPILKSLAVKEWGADGIISSDATAIELMVGQRHYYKTLEEAAVASIKAGIGQILAFYLNAPKQVKDALADKTLTEADIDAALRGKYRTLIRLGLLDPPSMVPYSKIGTNGETEPWAAEKHKTVARDVARESVVLLKNAGGMLPLDRAKLKSIAVIGPHANEVLMDLYGGKPPYTISALQGIKDKVGAGVTVNFAATNADDAAVKAAKESDVAVVVVGNHPTCDAGANIVAIFNMDVSSKPCADKGEGREGRDRASIDLSQEELVKQVYAANPKTVVVLVSSFPYAINWSQANVPAILHMANATQELGTGLADVLFGDYNPAGRTNQTWPESLDQLPPITDYDIRDGHTYMYFQGEPLYPFGYGLSYTTFKYSKLRFSSAKLPAKGAVTVSVDITNTGERAGDEVVQLYVQHPSSKVARPNKELKGFQRVSLKPKQTRTVQIPLKAESLAWWDEKAGKWEVEPETIRLVVGGSSADVRLQKTITVTQ